MPGYRTTCFMVENQLLIDAGAATTALPLKDQIKINAILLTHSHLDHIRDLAFLPDNVFGKRDAPLKICGLAPTIRAVREHVFNHRLWPDFSTLPDEDNPVINFRELVEGETTLIEGFEVTPVKVNHVVPAAGFLVKKQGKGFLFSGDTGPTTDLWEKLSEEDQVSAVFLETTYPDRMEERAQATGHLTPTGARQEIEKADKDGLKVYLFHFMPQYLKEITYEVEAAETGFNALKQGDHILVS
ncbi:MAG: 3',5'-cyclic-nucleotide phosphodiesterase [bacterium]